MKHSNLLWLFSLYSTFAKAEEDEEPTFQAKDIKLCQGDGLRQCLISVYQGYSVCDPDDLNCQCTYSKDVAEVCYRDCPETDDVVYIRDFITDQCNLASSIDARSVKEYTNSIRFNGDSDLQHRDDHLPFPFPEDNTWNRNSDLGDDEYNGDLEEDAQVPGKEIPNDSLFKDPTPDCEDDEEDSKEDNVDDEEDDSDDDDSDEVTTSLKEHSSKTKSTSKPTPVDDEDEEENDEEDKNEEDDEDSDEEDDEEAEEPTNPKEGKKKSKLSKLKKLLKKIKMYSATENQTEEEWNQVAHEWFLNKKDLSDSKTDKYWKNAWKEHIPQPKKGSTFGKDFFNSIFDKEEEEDSSNTEQCLTFPCGKVVPTPTATDETDNSEPTSTEEEEFESSVTEIDYESDATETEEDLSEPTATEDDTEDWYPKVTSTEDSYEPESTTEEDYAPTYTEEYPEPELTSIEEEEPKYTKSKKHHFKHTSAEEEDLDTVVTAEPEPTTSEDSEEYESEIFDDFETFTSETDAEFEPTTIEIDEPESTYDTESDYPKLTTSCDDSTKTTFYEEPEPTSIEEFTEESDEEESTTCDDSTKTTTFEEPKATEEPEEEESTTCDDSTKTTTFEEPEATTGPDEDEESTSCDDSTKTIDVENPKVTTTTEYEDITSDYLTTTVIETDEESHEHTTTEEEESIPTEIPEENEDDDEDDCTPITALPGYGQPTTTEEYNEPVETDIDEGDYTTHAPQETSDDYEPEEPTETDPEPETPEEDDNKDSEKEEPEKKKSLKQKFLEKFKKVFKKLGKKKSKNGSVYPTEDDQEEQVEQVEEEISEPFGSSAPQFQKKDDTRILASGINDDEDNEYLSGVFEDETVILENDMPITEEDEEQEVDAELKSESGSKAFIKEQSTTDKDSNSQKAEMKVAEYISGGSIVGTCWVPLLAVFACMAYYDLNPFFFFMLAGLATAYIQFFLPELSGSSSPLAVST